MSRVRHGAHLLALVAYAVAFGVACGAAFAHPNPTPPVPSDGRSAAPADPAAVPRAEEPRLALPTGRAIGLLRADQCTELLDSWNVEFSALDAEAAPGVEIPVRLEGTLGFLTVTARGPSEANRIYDCRLLVALLAWSEDLESVGIVGIEHLSTYRPRARVARTGRPSAHASATAIDVGRFRMRDGAILDVVEVWADAVRGAEPCAHIDDESDELRRVRNVVCAAVERDLFQVVLTPHFDRAHRNHVHLELRANVSWSYVR